MTETLTHQKHVPQQYEAQQPAEDFHLPGDSHVAKHIYYDRDTRQAVRKVITPNHLGRLEVKFVPDTEVAAAHDSSSYDYQPRH
jgi:hypothetical protein